MASDLSQPSATGQSSMNPGKMNILAEWIGSRQTLVLLLILGMALALRLAFFVGIGFNDDSYYLEYAEKIYKGLPFDPPRYVWSIRIGVYLPVVLSWKLFGISELSTSFFFLIYSLGSVAVVYFLGKELFSTEVGLLASFIMAWYPIDVIYSTQVGPDVPFQLFSSLSVLFFLKSYKYSQNCRMWAFLCGLTLGTAYLFKEPVILIVICFCFYGFWDALIAKRSGSIRSRNGFYVLLLNKKLVFASFIIPAGFLLPYLCQDTYLHSLTGERFFAEKAKEWTLRNDPNKHDDFQLYPRALLNIDESRFEWIHSKPLFGLMYYFVFASFVWLVFWKRFSRNEILLLLWMLVLFLFFQYGLHLISTRILADGMRPRHLRFLIPMSVPAALITARAFALSNWRNRTAKAAVLLFFVASSVYFIHQNRLFLRNGMGYVRDTAYYLANLEPKPIYIPDAWTISKFKFFWRYDEDIIKRLVVYECTAIDCSDTNQDSGQYIQDAYVATFVSPYTYINTIDPKEKVYPAFMSNPSDGWKLLTTIDHENYGIFSRYKPKIYHVDK